MRMKAVPMAVLITMAMILAVGMNGVLAQQEGLPGGKPTGTTHIIQTLGGRLNPAVLEINRGDTVIWLAADQPCNIYFSEGTPVKLACVAPTRFRLNEDEAYTSGIIPPGGTASLCFVEPGTFEYVMFVRGGAGGQVGPRMGIPTGRIIVK